MKNKPIKPGKGIRDTMKSSANKSILKPKITEQDFQDFLDEGDKLIPYFSFGLHYGLADDIEEAFQKALDEDLKQIRDEKE